MATLFVFNSVANVSADPSIDAQKFKLGHVIDVLEDGVSGGAEVDGAKKTGLFQLVSIPGVPAAQMRPLCATDPVPPFGSNPTTYPRLRINILDIAALKAVFPPNGQGIVVAPDAASVQSRVSVVVATPINVVVG